MSLHGCYSSPQSSGCHTVSCPESWAPAPPSPVPPPPKTNLEWFSLLHILSQSFVMWGTECTQNPDRIHAATSKPKFSPADLDQVSPNLTHQHVMLWLGLQAQAKWQQGLNLGQIFPRHPVSCWKAWGRVDSLISGSRGAPPGAGSCMIS